MELRWVLNSGWFTKRDFFLPANPIQLGYVGLYWLPPLLPCRECLSHSSFPSVTPLNTQLREHVFVFVPVLHQYLM